MVAHPSLDISAITDHLQRGQDGIWFAGRRSDISHPEDCQDWYLAVEDQSYWFKHRAACIVECLRRFPPPGPVFDIGGGNGHVTCAMKQAGYETALVEPSIQAAINARQREVDPVICATLADAQFPEGSVSAVGLFDVLEHIEDDLAFLQELRRLLASQGRLYLTVPAYQAIWSSHDDLVGHFRRYTIGSVSARLLQAGFQVEFSSYLFALLPVPIFFFRSVPTRLGLRKEDHQQRFEKEHAAGASYTRTLAEWVFDQERKLLKRGWRIPWGSSCLIVATVGVVD